MASRSSYDSDLSSTRNRETAAGHNLDSTPAIEPPWGQQDNATVSDRLLEELLAAMPPDARLVAQARRLDYSWVEIARARGRTVDQVQSGFRDAIHAAWEKLRAE